MTQSVTRLYLQIFGISGLFLVTHCGVKKDPLSPVKAPGPHIEWQQQEADKAENDQKKNEN